MPVWVVVTDFDVHMLWIQKNLSGYCVASEEVAWRLKDRGVTGSEIRVTGIPIAPAFSVRRSKEECARELGLDPERQTVLLMAGAAGVIPLHKLARRLLDLGHDVQLIAVAGKSRRLLGALQEVASGAPDRMRAIGYSSTIERLMRASDLAITKPGGLTTAECLAMGVPMLIVSPIPGQEERNADFLLEQGAAFKAYDAAGVEYRVRSLLGEPARLRAMKENAGRIGKPEAATDILRIALRDLTATAVRSSTGCL